jgi:hypothetical protein
MDFDFGQTPASKKFFDSHPAYFEAFAHLIKISNATFGRNYRPKNRLEDIGFGLGHTCREDYLDIAFLFINGHLNAASKLLRGLYERALSLAYMIQNPEKAERFVRFAAIQEHRAMQAALRVVSEEEFDRVMASKMSAAQMRELYRQIKPEFEITDCAKCKTKRVQTSWDIDVASMAQKAGAPFDRGVFLLGYTVPTLNIHATLASTYDGTRTESELSKDGDVTLILATEIFLQVLRSQNILFSLGLDAEFNSFTENFRRVWPDLDS